VLVAVAMPLRAGTVMVTVGDITSFVAAMVDRTKTKTHEIRETQWVWNHSSSANAIDNQRNGWQQSIVRHIQGT